MDIFKIALALHLFAGTVALATYWIVGLMRKGTPLHRRVGQVYLVAMLLIVVTGIPLVLTVADRGQPVGALFLTYLLVLVGNASWGAWRAIRDRRDRAAFFGHMYWFVAALTALSGLGIIALGVQTGAVLLQVFGSVGVFGGIGAWRSWRRARTDPKWWLKEHYGAMIGNGVATHIAFFGIGLRKLLPGVDPVLLQNFAWLVPLGASLVAAWWLGRKYGGSKPLPREQPDAAPAAPARPLA